MKDLMDTSMVTVGSGWCLDQGNASIKLLIIVIIIYGCYTSLDKSKTTSVP